MTRLSEIRSGGLVQALPCLGEVPHRALIPGSIKAWTSS